MFQVRPARRADAASIADFQIRMARETEDLALDPPTVLAGVEAVFDRPGLGAYYVAQEEARLLGCLLVVDEWSDWRNGKVWWIHSLYVVPEARGRGVFKAMYSMLRDTVARTEGLRGLRLYVDKRNARAQKVYQSLGMSAEHYHLYEWLK